VSDKFSRRRSIPPLLLLHKSQKSAVKLRERLKLDPRLQGGLPRNLFGRSAEHLCDQSATLLRTEVHAGNAATAPEVMSRLLARGIDGINACHQQNGSIALVLGQGVLTCHRPIFARNLVLGETIAGRSPA